MDKNDIIEYVMTTPHNTNKAVLSSMLNQLTESGSGSSSDFSGAEVTLVNSPRFSEGLPHCETLGDMAGIQVLSDFEDGTYTVPLWKGHLYVILYDTTATVLGDAELIYGGAAVDIYGDCTITKVS